MKMIMYKSQSAMEYLTTYGWALLIIALALASLFYLGLFNQGGIVNNECIFPSNFICLNGFVSANGNLALSIKQETQNPIVITAIGCNTNSSNIVMASIFPTIDLPIGAQTNLTATCYSGTSAFSGKIGDIFSGYVMINYTDTLSGYSKIVKGTVISKISTSSGPLTFTPVAFVPLTITNLQSIPTSSPFQTAIEFNPSTYSSYEASDLGNIRFFSGSTELYSWCETGCTSASSSSIFWVKLPQGVAASSTLSVNMSFGANTLNYDGNYAGEAPQLSSTYAEYDNGANVFNGYWDFAGTSLPAGWTSSVGSTGSVTVNNGATLASGTGGLNGWGTINHIFTMPSTNQIIIDVYGNTAETGRQRMYLTNTGASSQYGGYLTDVGFDYGVFGSSEITSGDLQYFWNAYYSPSNPSFSININYIVQYILTGSTFYFNILSQSETGIGSQSTTQPSITNVLSLINDDDSGVTQSTYYWIRFRAYPPNGVMPSVTFGTVQSV